MAKTTKTTAAKKTTAKSAKSAKTAKTRNPYERGLYAKGFEFIQKTSKGIVTRSALVKFLAGIIRKDRAAVTELPSRYAKITMDEYRSDDRINSAAEATATVLLSPRAAGTDQSKAPKGKVLSTTGRGDCRGNFSAMGHVYFMDLLKRKADKDGKKPEQRFRLRWRKEILDKAKRPVSSTEEVTPSKSKKTAKTAKTVKTVKTVKATSAKAAKTAAKAKADKAAAAKVRKAASAKARRAAAKAAKAAEAAVVEPIAEVVEPIAEVVEPVAEANEMILPDTDEQVAQAEADAQADALTA